MARRKQKLKTTFELSESDKDAQRFHPFSVHPHLEAEVIDPPESKRIPKGGAWVMVLRPPTLAECRFERGQFFFARHGEDTDPVGFDPWGRYKLRVYTPWGEACLWPYEYSVYSIGSVFDMYTAGEILFNVFNETPVTKLNSTLFYIRSRGIPLSEAMVMALGTFEEPVGWFEPTPEIAAMIKGAFG